MFSCYVVTLCFCGGKKIQVRYTTLQYVHRKSNHPPITTKNIPAGINRRLLSLSLDKASFDQATPLYQKALDQSGYHYTLHYEPTATAKRRNRQRNNILWYNPPPAPIQRKRQHQHRSQIPNPSRQTLP